MDKHTSKIKYKSSGNSRLKVWDRSLKRKWKLRVIWLLVILSAYIIIIGLWIILYACKYQGRDHQNTIYETGDDEDLYRLQSNTATPYFLIYDSHKQGLEKKIITLQFHNFLSRKTRHNFKFTKETHINVMRIEKPYSVSSVQQNASGDGLPKSLEVMLGFDWVIEYEIVDVLADLTWYGINKQER